MRAVSVVIPVLGRHEVLGRVLAGLAGQADVDEVEIVLVSDAADPEPEKLVRVAATADVPAEVHRATVRGASAARNVGWRAARHPIVLFLGGDILPVPRMLAEHLDMHESHPEPQDAVLGEIVWARRLPRTPFMRWLDANIQFDYGAIRGERASWQQLYSSNVSLKTALLERVGGFDEVRFPFLYEDLDLGRRLDDHGLRVWYRAAARGRHDHPPRLEDWKRRMEATAVAERTWVDVHPEQIAYFHDKFARAQQLPAARGLGRHLIGVVPRRTPWLGPRLWGSADAYYLQALAPAFMRGWAAA